MHVIQPIPDMRNRKGDDCEPAARAGLLSPGPAEHAVVKRYKQQQAVLQQAISVEVRSRLKPHLQWAVYAIFTIGTLQEQYHILPSLLVNVLMLLGAGLLARRILTFRRWGEEHRSVPRFLWCFSALVAELCWENVMVWLVSAVDLRKYDDPPGLQDNVGMVCATVAQHSKLLSWLLYFRWADIKHFLAALLGLALGSLWDQTPYTGFGLMARVLLAHCCTRIIRVSCFMSTVLPSPRPGCYSQRFPPVPGTWQGILWVGVTQMRGFGGCNDLIFSGHGAFWSLAPLALQTYYPGKVSWLLWLALAQTSVRDVLEHQHYSVDMLLAPVVSAAVWHWLKWVYPEDEPLPKRQEGAKPDKLNAFVVGLIMFALFIAAVIVIVGKA